MFIPEHLIIEEQRKREKQRNEQARIPLYAPRPMPRHEPAGEKRRSPERESGRSVVIVDMNDYSIVE